MLLDVWDCYCLSDMWGDDGRGPREEDVKEQPIDTTRGAADELGPNG